MVTTHNLVGVQHPQLTIVIKLLQHGHKLLIMNTMTWRPATGGSQYELPKAFHEGPCRMLSQGRQNLCRRPWHSPKVFQNFARK